ncbi:MAG TPA: NFACT RNA binding domain-containing protein [Ignavibacteriaceae bacterium]|nr:NFACT RNA binding domain-containing protein [Ignavibacteriaceae bacterium]
MYKNYFLLRRFVCESKDIINNLVINDIFTQEKNRLIISLGTEENIFLEISVDQNRPYILIKDKYSRAKKNTISLFPSLHNSIIKNIEIAHNERVIKITASSGELYFQIRGNRTNIFCESKNEYSAFLKSEENYLADSIKEINSFSYSNSRIYIFDEIASNDFNMLNKEFPFLGKEVILEVKTRLEYFDKDKVIDEINKIIHSILNDNIAAYINDDDGSIRISAGGFHIFPFTNKVEFESYVQALKDFFKSIYKQETINLYKKRIEKHLLNELDKLADKINNLRSTAEKIDRSEEYNKIANLLLINIYKLKKGMSFIELEDIYNSNQILKVKLNPELDPKGNISSYFDKSKNEKKIIEQAQFLYIRTIQKYEEVKFLFEDFKKITVLEDYKKLFNNLRIKMDSNENKKEDLKDKFKHYIIEGKYNVYVGKDSKNNDLLTTSFAKQNDLWFHAKSVPGSHVVLRIDNSKEVVPKNIIKKAASLAAYHSKAKTAGMVPVSYTFKKYVVKRKGMEPGKVALMKESVVIVEPEIPANVEYVE